MAIDINSSSKSNMLIDYHNYNSSSIKDLINLNSLNKSNKNLFNWDLNHIDNKKSFRISTYNYSITNKSNDFKDSYNIIKNNQNKNTIKINTNNLSPTSRNSYLYNSRLAKEYEKFVDKIIIISFKSLIYYKNIPEINWKKALNSIFNYFSFYSLKINASPEFIKEIIDLGNFGQSVHNRRLSAYYARKLICIISSQEGEIRDLSDRLYRLSSDNDSLVRIELYKSLRVVYYICAQTSGDKKKNIKKVFSNTSNSCNSDYSNESDNSLKSDDSSSIYKRNYSLFNADKERQKENDKKKEGIDMLYFNNFFLPIINNHINSKKDKNFIEIYYMLKCLFEVDLEAAIEGLLSLINTIPSFEKIISSIDYNKVTNIFKYKGINILSNNLINNINNYINQINSSNVVISNTKDFNKSSKNIDLDSFNLINNKYNNIDKRTVNIIDTNDSKDRISIYHIKRREKYFNDLFKELNLIKNNNINKLNNESGIVKTLSDLERPNEIVFNLEEDLVRLISLLKIAKLKIVQYANKKKKYSNNDNKIEESINERINVLNKKYYKFSVYILNNFIKPLLLYEEYFGNLSLFINLDNNNIDNNINLKSENIVKNSQVNNFNANLSNSKSPSKKNKKFLKNDSSFSKNKFSCDDLLYFVAKYTEQFYKFSKFNYISNNYKISDINKSFSLLNNNISENIIDNTNSDNLNDNYNIIINFLSYIPMIINICDDINIYTNICNLINFLFKHIYKSLLLYKCSNIEDFNNLSNKCPFETNYCIKQNNNKSNKNNTLVNDEINVITNNNINNTNANNQQILDFMFFSQNMIYLLLNNISNIYSSVENNENLAKNLYSILYNNTYFIKVFFNYNSNWRIFSSLIKLLCSSINIYNLESFVNYIINLNTLFYINGSFNNKYSLKNSDQKKNISEKSLISSNKTDLTQDSNQSNYNSNISSNNNNNNNNNNNYNQKKNKVHNSQYLNTKTISTNIELSVFLIKICSVKQREDLLNVVEQYLYKGNFFDRRFSFYFYELIISNLSFKYFITLNFVYNFFNMLHKNSHFTSLIALKFVKRLYPLIQEYEDIANDLEKNLKILNKKIIDSNNNSNTVKLLKEEIKSLNSLKINLSVINFNHLVIEDNNKYDKVIAFFEERNCLYLFNNSNKNSENLTNANNNSYINNNLLTDKNCNYTNSSKIISNNSNNTGIKSKMFLDAPFYKGSTPALVSNLKFNENGKNNFSSSNNSNNNTYIINNESCKKDSINQNNCKFNSPVISNLNCRAISPISTINSKYLNPLKNTSIKKYFEVKHFNSKTQRKDSNSSIDRLNIKCKLSPNKLDKLKCKNNSILIMHKNFIGNEKDNTEYKSNNINDNNSSSTNKKKVKLVSIINKEEAISNNNNNNISNKNNSNNNLIPNTNHKNSVVSINKNHSISKYGKKLNSITSKVASIYKNIN